MNFLKNLPLKKVTLCLLAGVVVIFVTEFVFISYKIERLEEIEEKKDFARHAQVQGQQVAYMTELHIDGQTSAPAEIYARIKELDDHLKVLSEGGRVAGTDNFLDPLSRLPSITFRGLDKSWQTYRNNVLSHLGSDASVVSTEDSVATAELQFERNSALLGGQWLAVSGWFERILKDLSEEAVEKKAAVESWFVFFAFIDVILLGSLFYFFREFVLKPIERLTYDADKRIQNFDVGKNEFGVLTNEINEILEELKDATEFVAAISEGKLDFDYKSLDEGYAEGKNRLADSLILMQARLKTLQEEEHKRQWANEGLTKFVDILRSSNDDITVLGDKIISSLVKYTNSNQGGLYILNDEDERNRYLELVSLFAFDHKKFEKQKLRLGEGILGQTFLEKETTVLNEIPEEYIRITSGLGGANPKSLLIVPLKVDRNVYGIVELASFKNFQNHEIEFVEKLAETIASTLASVKVAQKNRNLIEQFQQQTEEMRAQEEEMRQNMEELQATQEEMSRKEQDSVRRILELENAVKVGMPGADVEKMKEGFASTIAEYEQRVNMLEQKLAEKPARSDDWAVAEEMERTLRIQMETLRIASEESARK